MTAHGHRPTMLLTGATGVVGRALIDDLAGDHDIVCLRYRTPVADRRVAEFRGDLASPTLGLSRADYAVLARRVDLVVHGAAATSYALEPDRIRATNLGGTERVMAFARRAEAPLYHVSTAFVADPPQDDGSGRFDGVAAYIRSKIDAERLVLSSGQPAVILRPSLVVGDSRDGHISRFQGFHRGLAAMVRGTVPVMPAAADSLVDVVPQDVLARAAGRVVRAGVTSGEFWLTAGAGAMTLGRIVRACLEFAALRGLHPAPPRLVPGAALDRLLLSLLDDPAPPDLVARVHRFAEMLWLFQTSRVLPSSLPALGERVSTASSLEVLRRNLEYWDRAVPAGRRPEVVGPEVVGKV